MWEVLVNYSIEIARKFTSDDNICVSTDDLEIVDVVEKVGLKVPFLRPQYLASDTASTNDVLVHAIEHYKEKGISYDSIVLLQPTSPLRTVQQIQEAIDSYEVDLDMVVGVKKSEVAVVLRQENEAGMLEPVFSLNDGIRRQDAKPMYEINGAVYVINVNSLIKKGMSGFSNIKKYVMPEINSMDIDSLIDWEICEVLLKKGIIEL